ncbi:fumarylacetoacetate hydrolase family protein [bacterium]|nr:fumarylacetoacetate hydrolase family protein [bacterium]
MRYANLAGRAVLLHDDRALDIERASRGRFTADPQALYADWAALRAWARDVDATAAQPYAVAELGAPAPRPTQVFGIGLNYRDHAAESGMPLPERPATFTKFPTCLTGPEARVALPSPAVDWEVELVVVIGARAHRVAEADAWQHVAGLTVGQDLSERVVQWSGGGQFSLGKSFPGFGPMGPWLVTPDELADPDDLELGCEIAGEVLQKGRTSDMVFSVPRLIAELSAVLPLLPGDVIFTGTPAGIGATRKPPRFLQPGEELHSWIAGIGSLHTTLVSE